MATVRVMVDVEKPSPCSARFIMFNIDESQVREGQRIKFTVEGTVQEIFPTPLPATGG